MRAMLVSFFTAFVFALGLGIAGMTRPEKVVAFLDVFGSWDPSLAFVMGSAVLVYSVAYRRVLRRTHPVMERMFHLPQRIDIDRRLLVGAAVFGTGWGLVGFCPGPALVGLASGIPGVLVFVAAMLAGMGLFHLWGKAAADRA